MNSQGPKCPKCRKVAIHLIKENVPKRTILKYPNGICKNCKKKDKKRMLKLIGG